MGASIRPPTVDSCLQSCSLFRMERPIRQRTSRMSPYVEEGSGGSRSDISLMVFCLPDFYAFNSSLAFCSEYFNETILEI